MASKKKDGKRQEADWDPCPKGSLSALSGKLQGRKRRRRFAVFDQALTARDAAIRSGQERLAALTESLNGKEAEASKLLENATKMLGGATIAGLSATYHTKATDVDKQLKWARDSFYGLRPRQREIRGGGADSVAELFPHGQPA